MKSNDVLRSEPDDWIMRYLSELGIKVLSNTPDHIEIRGNEDKITAAKSRLENLSMVRRKT